MRLLVISGSLSMGGTATSLIDFLAAMKRQDVDVALYLTHPEGAAEKLPEGVCLVSIPELDRIARMPSGLQKLIFMIRRGVFPYALAQKINLLFPKKDPEAQRREAMRLYQLRDWAIVKGKGAEVDLTGQYDAVLSWEELLTDYLLSTRIRCRKKIGWIHPDYRGAGFCEAIDRRTLAGLDALVAVSESGAQTLRTVFPEWKEKIYAVPNRIDAQRIRRLAAEPAQGMEKKGFTMVTVARIQNVSKAFDRAVRIAQRLKERGLAFVWYVVGDGEDRPQLQREIEERQLSGYMVLLGAKANPYPYMAAADLFVLQSYYEGRPLAVDEAMLVGTPVLVTDYHAAREQVDSGKVGLVVENDEAAIVSALESLISDPHELESWRSELAQRGWQADCRPFWDMMESQGVKQAYAHQCDRAGV